MRVPTVVEDTLELGGVHIIAAPPVASGDSALRQLAVSLAGQSEPVSPVLTAVLQPAVVLQRPPTTTGAVLPHHPSGVPWVRAEHRLYRGNWELLSLGTVITWEH